jgi:hypothetical protein
MSGKATQDTKFSTYVAAAVRQVLRRNEHALLKTERVIFTLAVLVSFRTNPVQGPRADGSSVPKVDIHQFAEFFETLEQACVRSAATETWTLVVPVTSDILSGRPDADASRHNNAEG